MKSIYFPLFLISLFFLSSCAFSPVKPSMTPLEIQSIQTRDYEFSKDIVFRSVVSVFQDLGYSITNADLNSGLISAESASKNTTDFFAAFGGFTKVSQTKATAFVEKIGSTTKVRLNLVETENLSSAYGQNTRDDNAMVDVNLYQSAFEKIENAIFIRSSN
jgi:hypothetical protein